MCIVVEAEPSHGIMIAVDAAAKTVVSMAPIVRSAEVSCLKQSPVDISSCLTRRAVVHVCITAVTVSAGQDMSASKTRMIPTDVSLPQ